MEWEMMWTTCEKTGISLLGQNGKELPFQQFKKGRTFVDDVYKLFSSDWVREGGGDRVQQWKAH